MKLTKTQRSYFCWTMLGFILTASGIAILTVESEDDQEQRGFIIAGTALMWTSVLIWMLGMVRCCMDCMDLDNTHPRDDNADLETDTIFREPTRIPQSNV